MKDSIKNIKQLLSKPFPREEGFAETLKIISGISLFVFLFLYIFKPFGIHLLESGQLLVCLGFGAATFVASVIYEFIAVRVVKLKVAGARFTFGRWITYFLGAMLCISLANFLFVRIALFGDIQWSLFPVMIRSTFAIGIFPIVVLGTIALLRQERKYQAIADEINHQGKNRREVEKPDSEGGLQETLFGIAAERIRYVEAMQNYIKIGHINHAGQLEEHTERATLSSIAIQTPNNSLLRCHRSYMVNRDFITSTAGNAQGLLLSLLDCPRKIPVSRSYITEFKQH